MTRSRDGFTLLELLIVLTIAAVVSGIAIQSMGSALAATKIDRSAAVVGATLRQAKTTAARLRQPVRVVFDTVNKKISIGRHVSPYTVYETFYFDSTSELHVTRLAATDQQLVFYPNGLADTGDTIIVAVTDAYTRRITMNRAGQIRITTPTP